MPVEMLEEPEVIPATKSPHGYLASPISDNISQREDGSLIVVGCPVARTGFQDYAISNLPQEKARELGIDIGNPQAAINLYRPAEEVFAPTFLASLNGIAIVDGHPPEGVFVDKRNFPEYARGHLQNPRRGPEPMEDGEWPLIADLIISGEPLVGKVLRKEAREISLGYDFSIDRDGKLIIQCSMVGNHCAVVPKGRAGDLVRIEDAAPEPAAAESPPAKEVDQTSLDAKPSSEIPIASVSPAYKPVTINFNRKKEKLPVITKEKMLRLLFGKHLIESARATDADPEAIAEMAEAMHEEPAAVESQDKKTKDAELLPELEEEEQSEDRRRMHDALDAMLDEEEMPAMDRKRAKDRKRRAKDADINELKSLLDQFLSEEEGEPEHAATDLEEEEAPEVDPGQLEDALAGEEPVEEELEDSFGEPGEEQVESGEEELAADDPTLTEPEDTGVEDRKAAKDKKRATDGAKETLRMLRPFVARVNDKALNTAFNTALGVVTRSSRPSTGSYSRFGSAARARDKAPNNPRARAADAGGATADQKLQAAYDAARGGK